MLARLNSEPSIAADLWERTPPEVQAYLRALEARVCEAQFSPLGVRQQYPLLF
jgi:hypothetical protein